MIKLHLGLFGNRSPAVNVMTVDVLLIVLFVSGALAGCTNEAALFITAPKKLEALSGSCLQIPCSFRPKDEQKFNSTRKIFGVWIKNQPEFGKNPNNVIFNSSGAVSIYPMSITGNLSQRDCTTLFTNLTTNYTDTYFFRVESEPFKATAPCDPLQITVRDSPWRPNITISGDLKEKESVTITCSALTPCPHSPPQLTWNLTQDSHNKIEENTDGSFTTKIQQTITLSDTHDGKKISCSARYPVNQGKDTKTAETEETLSVSRKQNVQLGSFLGGITVIILLICLIICARWLKLKHQTKQQTQIQAHEELFVEEPASKTEEEEENIHYEEIDLFSLGYKASSDSVQDRGQQQDTVYSQMMRWTVETSIPRPSGDHPV
ncbi:sialic acid-binding Ig-like lectin 9 [Oreochromis aureus]|uniref:sialic acid-binding Ig-like lectin 9 n=1 Tax=Oreochromis aureus TaxID=47969 RepID=UPI0019542FD6|nr:sialic acid-binding Ig-like lectin 9 [Oreochromis aureus]